jgi:predicted MPP superfamily phosphohydrolase
MVLFALFATSMMALLLVYLGWRSGSHLPQRLRMPLWITLGLYWFGTIAVFATLRSDSPASWVSQLHWTIFLLMGLVSIAIVGTLALDLGSLLLSLVDWTRAKLGAEKPLADAVDPERRRLLGGVLTAGVWSLAGGITVLGSREAKLLSEVVEVEIPIEDLDPALEGLRIVQLTDLHIGPTIKKPWIEGIVERVNALEADLVAITGDVVDGQVRALVEDVAPLAQLQSRHGSWLVTGNHEYYSGVEVWVEEFRRLGIRVLLNEHQVLRHDDSALVIAGITDYRAERMKETHRSDPAAAIAGAPEGILRLLLAHQPRSARLAHAAGHFDLQLSGHTHGGQFFPWNLLVPFIQPFAVGLHQLGKMWIYTSRGTCYWGPPIRMGAPAEITLIRLTRA